MIIFVIKCYSYSYGTGDTVTDEHTGIDSTVIWGPTELMGDERYIMFRYINIYFECCKSCNFEIGYESSNNKTIFNFSRYWTETIVIGLLPLLALILLNYGIYVKVCQFISFM